MTLNGYRALRTLQKKIFGGHLVPSTKLARIKLFLRPIDELSVQGALKQAKLYLDNQQHGQADMAIDRVLHHYPHCEAALTLKKKVAEDAARADLSEALSRPKTKPFCDTILEVLEHEREAGIKWIAQSGLGMVIG